MFKNVFSGEERLDGYCFESSAGVTYKVTTPSKFGTVSLEGALDERVGILRHEIPKVIKLLEAAYTHKVETHKD